MALKSYETVHKWPQELFPGGQEELAINVVHFANQLLLQVRYNGEMDTTYEVSQKGLGPNTSVANFQPLAGETADDDELVKDNLSRYMVVTRLGDSTDMKLPVICMQIAELFHSVILQTDRLPATITSPNLIITLSSKIWKGDPNQDFGKLVFILKCIKDMYN